jgi:polar amino acid transport system ATP-binding protein
MSVKNASTSEPFVVETENLVKRFGDREVLRSISLRVQRHEVVTLIGASGSGKSTLLRCLNMLEQIDGGKISLFGQDLSDPDVRGELVRRHVGIVFQAFNLFPHKNVLENITLGPVRALGLKKSEAEQRAHELLARFALSEKATEYPDRLSGGQQQRVAIIRAIAMEPELLLLDEITSALDPELVSEVLDVVRELAHSGMTMLIATHEMNFARDVSSRVCFLADGEIVEQRQPDELFKNPQDPRTQEFLRSLTRAGRL